MIFKLKCKVCGNIVLYDSEAEKATYRKCSKCEQSINMNIETKLDNVADMQGFELIGLEHSFLSKLLAEDLSNIERIFDSAIPDNQKIIANIIDKLYLMFNRHDEDTLKEIETLLSKCFFDSCGKGIDL